MSIFRVIIALIAFVIASVLIATPAYMRGEGRTNSLFSSSPVAVDDFYTVHGGTYIGLFMSNDSGDSISFTISSTIRRTAHYGHLRGQQIEGYTRPIWPTRVQTVLLIRYVTPTARARQPRYT